MSQLSRENMMVDDEREYYYENILSDGEMVKICRRIDKYNEKIEQLIQELRDTIGDDAVADLESQCWQPAWASHIIKNYLHQPENWETTQDANKRIVYKRKK